MLILLKGNVYGSWAIKGGLDWVKTSCLVIRIHFKTPVLSGKLKYSRKLRRYLGRDGRVFGSISAGMKKFLGSISAVTEEFLGGILAGTEQCKNGRF